MTTIQLDNYQWNYSLLFLLMIKKPSWNTHPLEHLVSFLVRGGIGNKLDFLNKMATVKARKVLFFNFSSCILCQFEYTSPCTQNIAWWPWQTFHWWRSWSPLPRFPWGCPSPGRGLSAPPSPSRTRKNPPEQSLVNRRMQTRLYVVVSEPFLETTAMGIGFLSQ